MLREVWQRKANNFFLVGNVGCLSTVIVSLPKQRVDGRVGGWRSFFSTLGHDERTKINIKLFKRKNCSTCECSECL